VPGGTNTTKNCVFKKTKYLLVSVRILRPFEQLCGGDFLGIVSLKAPATRIQHGIRSGERDGWRLFSQIIAYHNILSFSFSVLGRPSLVTSYIEMEATRALLLFPSVFTPRSSLPKQANTAFLSSFSHLFFHLFPTSPKSSIEYHQHYHQSLAEIVRFDITLILILLPMSFPGSGCCTAPILL
jgi:hypothetical protein